MDDPKIAPLHDRVVVRPRPAETKSSGGIIIPDIARQRPQYGIVIAAGPGKKDDPTTVKPGNNVLFARNAGSEIPNTDWLIMRESDILAVI